ncbi:hypothetical protein JP0057_05000 [Helicobacter pylori]|nr:hypothetical protein JP0057_05000 [Helicobacter pylori]GHR68824.1 hypothetical protein JP0104_10380 [Helicobacter pylori]
MIVFAFIILLPYLYAKFLKVLNAILYFALTRNMDIIIAFFKPCDKQTGMVDAYFRDRSGQ